MRTLICLLLATGVAHAETPKQPLLTAWEALLKTGCDLEKAHVRTPIEARVLRNLPYAKQGYVFKSLELTAVYQADGGWYAPKADAKPSFTPAEGACIKALKTHEKALRQMMGWSKAWESRFTASTGAVVSLRTYTAHMGGITYARKSGKDSIQWELGGADCKGKPATETRMCNVIQLICDATSCMINAPG